MSGKKIAPDVDSKYKAVFYKTASTISDNRNIIKELEDFIERKFPEILVNSSHDDPCFIHRSLGEGFYIAVDERFTDKNRVDSFLAKIGMKRLYINDMSIVPDEVKKHFNIKEPEPVVVMEKKLSIRKQHTNEEYLNNVFSKKFKLKINAGRTTDNIFHQLSRHMNEKRGSFDQDSLKFTWKGKMLYLGIINEAMDKHIYNIITERHNFQPVPGNEKRGLGLEFIKPSIKKEGL